MDFLRRCLECFQVYFWNIEEKYVYVSSPTPIVIKEQPKKDDYIVDILPTEDQWEVVLPL